MKSLGRPRHLLRLQLAVETRPAAAASRRQDRRFLQPHAARLVTIDIKSDVKLYEPAPPANGISTLAGTPARIVGGLLAGTDLLSTRAADARLPPRARSTRQLGSRRSGACQGHDHRRDHLGAAKTRIDTQKTFTSNLMDSIDSGVGQLVDADMNKESTRLQALQVQQQLGIQALSIANGNSQSILSLFRG